MSDRKSIKPTERWDIFARDGFKCRYCGIGPPGAVLQVDHVKAVANGGKNRSDNLVTACEDCNRGKCAKLLPIPEKPKGPVSQEDIKRFSAAITEYPHVTGRLLDAMIAEIEYLGDRGVPLDVSSIVLALGAAEMAVIAYRGRAAGNKREFMKMVNVAFDDGTRGSDATNS